MFWKGIRVKKSFLDSPSYQTAEAKPVFLCCFFPTFTFTYILSEEYTDQEVPYAFLYVSGKQNGKLAQKYHKISI